MAVVVKLLAGIKDSQNRDLIVINDKSYTHPPGKIRHAQSGPDIVAHCCSHWKLIQRLDELQNARDLAAGY